MGRYLSLINQHSVFMTKINKSNKMFAKGEKSKCTSDLLLIKEIISLLEGGLLYFKSQLSIKLTRVSNYQRTEKNVRNKKIIFQLHEKNSIDVLSFFLNNYYSTINDHSGRIFQ